MVQWRHLPGDVLCFSWNFGVSFLCGDFGANFCVTKRGERSGRLFVAL